ncbi:hypothetical protein BDQ12DRAFT_717259 [Crucibulum laeve]|uniref:Uncharacterized protein n=1 Tax=Crucibulum laeve TaxID=68775 RepID=A0A5C3MF75_9AGAR|nr:hypothetical protein BDQ12DRAFT_717259 [Crucibulum laeve]
MNMMIELVALATIFFIAVLVMSVVNTELLVIPLQALSQVQAVTCLWIIFHAVQGKAWAENTSKEFVISRSVAFKSEDLESRNIS